MIQTKVDLSYFVYDESSPSCLRWARVPGGSDRLKPLDVAGGISKEGKYWRVHLGGVSHMCHKIIMLLSGVEIPDGMQIDHINGISLDNRISNLRLATGSQNQGNRGRQKNNSSGFKGVRFVQSHRKWRSTIWDQGKQLFIGYFDCPVLAAEAYDREAVRKWGEFARTNIPLAT